MFIPLIAPIEIAHKTLTVDALLTQRKLAEYIVNERQAHYLFTVKGNQPTLLQALQLSFERRGEPDYREPVALAHGRIESRAIWTTTTLNDYITGELGFPGVGQAFLIERRRTDKKTGKASTELAYGITSRTPDSATAQQLLTLNRNHWAIENSCHYVLDWNWDEDRGHIRTGHGPENITRLRRFAIGVIKANTRNSVAATLRKLNRNVRLVFDYLRMTINSQRRAAPDTAGGGRTN
jgi:predicted transposase YbfD/YdcC